MCAAVTFAQDDDGLLLRTLASSAGDCDTMASMMGSIMGARYGRVLCGDIQNNGKTLEADLKKIETAKTAHKSLKNWSANQSDFLITYEYWP